MIVYGTKIKSDISFPLDFSQETKIRYEIELSSKVPKKLKNAITYGLSLYSSHGRNVYLHSDRLIDSSSNRGQPWCFEVKEIVRFYWQSGDGTIYYELDDKGDVDLLNFWFVHQFLPIYMTLENMYDFIHAGAVEIEGKPILFIAPSMGGKSTLTDYFIKQGHVLVSDDKVPIYIEEGRWMAVGSHPYHRPFRDYEVFGYRAEHFIEEFKPIQAFYVLEKIDAKDNIVIEEIKGVEKFNILLSQYLYTVGFNRAQHMKHVTIMLGTIRIFKIKIPWDMKRLEEVYEAIIRHHNRV
ncbi:MAG: hypothetical protein ACWGHH_03965 [Sulfurovaceae bacterium]